MIIDPATARKLRLRLHLKLEVLQECVVDIASRMAATEVEMTRNGKGEALIFSDCRDEFSRFTQLVHEINFISDVLESKA